MWILLTYSFLILLLLLFQVLFKSVELLQLIINSNLYQIDKLDNKLVIRLYWIRSIIICCKYNIHWK
jgi:hypothetical protein